MSESILKEVFVQLVSNYTNDQLFVQELWNEIEKKYSDRKRYYHTCTHLENILTQINKVRNDIFHWDVILFTLFYHDIIYNPLRSDNEEKSAALAAKRLKQLAVSNEMMSRCKEQILATKSHIKSPDSDTNYFTDADLSVLGQPWADYSAYFKNVRKEYALYPDFIYNKGRKKVIEHFLLMDRIYKTDFFYHKFELQAKENLQKEWYLL